MPLRRALRETAFKVARQDLALFIEDHETRIREIVHEELQRLDDDLPEENLFIDIRVVALGDMVLQAVLNAMSRFLKEEFD